MHKINVCFFASLREEIGEERITLSLSGPLSIGEIKRIIESQIERPNSLSVKGIQASIDFEFARDNNIVDPQTTKEIAFFPPVTGG